MVVEGGVVLLANGVVLERVPVPVEVAAGVDKGRGRRGGGLASGVGHAARVLDAREAAVGLVEAAHGEPAQGLAVAARLESRAGLVDDGEVADVAVPAENLDGRLGVDLADGVMDQAEGAAARVGAGDVVAKEDEDVDVLGGDGVLKPLLLYHCGALDDLGRVRVAREVIEDAKGHDAEAVLGGEVLVGGTNVLILPGLGVEDLDVGGQVLVAPEALKLVEDLVGHIGNVKLVISW